MAQDNDAIVFLNEMQSTVKSSKVMTLCMMILTAVVCLGSAGICYWYVDQRSRDIYIMDDGAALSAQRASNGVQKDLEVIDHVTHFHELFFNLAPNTTTINQNIGRALELADESAYSYFNDLKEDRYYSNLININATQQITVDSIRVDVMSYPYRCETLNSLYILRNSNVTKYTFSTSCEVTEVSRTKENPHGLLIGKFYATKAELVEQRQR